MGSLFFFKPNGLHNGIDLLPFTRQQLCKLGWRVGHRVNATDGDFVFVERRSGGASDRATDFLYQIGGHVGRAKQAIPRADRSGWVTPFMVGTSGKLIILVSVVTARAFKRPDLMCCMTAGGVE